MGLNPAIRAHFQFLLEIRWKSGLCSKRIRNYTNDSWSRYFHDYVPKESVFSIWYHFFAAENLAKMISEFLWLNVAKWMSQSIWGLILTVGLLKLIISKATNLNIVSNCMIKINTWTQNVNHETTNTQFSIHFWNVDHFYFEYQRDEGYFCCFDQYDFCFISAKHEFFEGIIQ